MYSYTTENYLLLLSLLVLVVGPLLHQLARLIGSMLAGLDGFVFVTMGGLVFLHIVPESYHMAGWPALLAVVLGLLVPGWVEHRLHGLAGPAHTVALLLALVGIGLHAFADGLALGQGGHQGEVEGHMLSMAVVLHRLPVGLMVWFLIRPVYGLPLALGTLALIGVSTVLGAALGEAAVGGMASEGRGLFQALVAGSLLHVVLHRSYPIAERGATPQAARRYAGWGALGGLALTAFLATDHLDEAVADAGRVFLHLAWESAPALLLAYVVAGLVYGFMPRASLKWMGRGSSLSQAMRGMAFGLSLPICSWGIGRLAPTAADVIPGVSQQEEGGLADRLRRSLHTGLFEVVDDTAPWMVLGLVVAAIAAPLLEAGWLLDIADVAQVFIFAILGIPIYVCAAGVTPLAAVLVFKGVSPGAALAFLLTGPATNLTTFGVLSRLHGRRLALFFAGGIMALAVALGLGVDLMMPTLEVPPLAIEEGVEWWSMQGVCLLGLSALFMASLLRVGPRAFVAEVFSTGGEDEGPHHDHDHDRDNEYRHCRDCGGGEHQHG